MRGLSKRNFPAWCAALLICTVACEPAGELGPMPEVYTADGFVAAGALTPGCAGQNALLGIDVSEFQGVIDWRRVAAADVRFAFIRVGDGVRFKDLYFADNWRAARAAGIPRGAYHFFDPSEDAIEQAKFFVETVGALEAGDLPPVLDLETLRGVAPTQAIRGADLWIGYVRGALGVDPIVYTGPAFWEDVLDSPAIFEPYEPWISHFTGGCPWVPAPWNTTRFHQFTERGWIQGIDHYVDLNWFYGSADAFRALQVKAPNSQGSGDPTCLATSAESGQPCAEACIYSSWAVTQGYQSGTHDCGGQPCACVVRGRVRERCEVTLVPQGGPRGSPCASACVWSTWSVNAGVQAQTHLCGGEPCACVQEGAASLACVPSSCEEHPSAIDLAERLRLSHEQGLITLWDQTFWRADGSARIDGADALRNVEMTAEGRPALRSCYDDAPCGTTDLADDMLRALMDLRGEYGFQFFVTSIAGASHEDESSHYEGRAFDIDEIDGVRINGPTAKTASFMAACEALGASEVRGPLAGSAENRHHIHCAF